MTQKHKAKPNLYGENKTRRMINLTPTAWDMLKAQAQALETSPSDLIERFARGILPSATDALTLQHLGE